MPLLTAAEAQALGVGLDLDLASLQAVIDGEEAEMIRLFGPHGDGATPVTATVRPRGGSVYVNRPILSVSSASAAAYPGGTPITIASDQRYVWGDTGVVDLYPSGFAWEVWDRRAVVTLTYVPTDDRALRKQILLSLTQIATEVPASGSGGKVSGLGFSGDDSVSGLASVSGIDSARTSAYAQLQPFPVV